MSIVTCHRVREVHEGHDDCPGVPPFDVMSTDEQMLGWLRGEEDDMALVRIGAMRQASNDARRCFIENHRDEIERARWLPGNIAAISLWVDASYPPDLDREAWTRRRCDKVAEEAGEVISALGGMFGENPRKGITNGPEEVIDELLDTALAGLGAVYHLTEDDPVALLAAHADKVWARARATQEESSDGTHE